MICFLLNYIIIFYIVITIKQVKQFVDIYYLLY